MKLLLCFVKGESVSRCNNLYAKYDTAWVWTDVDFEEKGSKKKSPAKSPPFITFWARLAGHDDAGYVSPVVRSGDGTRTTWPRSLFPRAWWFSPEDVRSQVKGTIVSFGHLVHAKLTSLWKVVAKILSFTSYSGILLTCLKFKICSPWLQIRFSCLPGMLNPISQKKSGSSWPSETSARDRRHQARYPWMRVASGRSLFWWRRSSVAAVAVVVAMALKFGENIKGVLSLVTPTRHS